MPSMILSPEEPWLTFVGEYSCAPEDTARLEALLQNYYKEVGPGLIGLVGGAIHRKLEGSGVFTLSQWESDEAVLQVTRDTKLHPYFREINQLAQVRYTPCRTEFLVLPPSRQRAPILAAMGLVIGDQCCQTSFTIASASPDNYDEVLGYYRDLHDVTVRSVRGFMGAAVLTSFDRSRFFSYAQWADARLVEQALQLPGYKTALSKLARLATYERNWFEVVYAVRIPRTRGTLR